MMIEFWVCAMYLPGEGEDIYLYKLFRWHVLPRVGEHVVIWGDNISPDVEDVTHHMTAPHPGIEVDVTVNSSDVIELLRADGWKEGSPFYK